MLVYLSPSLPVVVQLLACLRPDCLETANNINLDEPLHPLASFSHLVLMRHCSENNPYRSLDIAANFNFRRLVSKSCYKLKALVSLKTFNLSNAKIDLKRDIQFGFALLTSIPYTSLAFLRSRKTPQGKQQKPRRQKSPTFSPRSLALVQTIHIGQHQP